MKPFSEDDVLRLVDAAIELLNMSRFLYWQGALAKVDDGSYIEAIEDMRTALARMGFEQKTRQEFESSLEKLLAGDPAATADFLSFFLKKQAFTR